MKLSIALAMSAIASASAAGLPFYKTLSKVDTTKDIAASSGLGQKIMSKARRLDEDEEADFTWVADYSLKFQGCFHMSQWNAEAEDEEDVRIMTKRLVRFRLCPSDVCSSSSTGGCSSGYGDYIVDLDEFVNSYMENKEQAQNQACEELAENCGCDNDDGKDDGFDEEQCEYDCYVNAGMSYCIEDEDAFNVQEYLECNQWELPEADDDAGRLRRLEEAEEEVAYYIGPYCANQGGDIYMGMFSDDTCTEFYDDDAGVSTYAALAGASLPYATESLIGSDCVSCLQVDDADDDDDANEVEVSETCMQLYESSGKCETELSIDDANENACTYMEGVKITRKNGTVQVAAAAASKSASAFIGIFAVSFSALAGYVYFLQTKLDGAKINLSDQ